MEAQQTVTRRKVEETSELAHLTETDVTPTSEKTFSYSEYLKIMEMANSISGNDEEKKFNLDSVYRMGEQMGYSREVIDRVIEMRTMSLDTILRDAKEFGGNLSAESQRVISGDVLLKDLRKAYPSVEFYCGFSWNLTLDFYMTEKKVVKTKGLIRTILGLPPITKEVKKRKKLASFGYTSDDQRSNEAYVNINVFSPLFLRACNDSITELNSRFNINPKKSIRYSEDLIQS